MHMPRSETFHNIKTLVQLTPLDAIGAVFYTVAGAAVVLDHDLSTSEIELQSLDWAPYIYWELSIKPSLLSGAIAAAAELLVKDYPPLAGRYASMFIVRDMCTYHDVLSDRR
jgi:hypothetical protein